MRARPAGSRWLQQFTARNCVKHVAVCTLLMAMICTLVSASALAQQHKSEIVIEPGPQVLLGNRLSIRLLGVPPHKEVILHAQWREDEVAWYAWAVFSAPDYGTIDLGETAPLRGTYEGVDPSGLFWSMQPNVPPSCGRATEIRRMPVGPTYLDLEIDGEIVATAQVELIGIDPRVVMSEIDRQDFQAKYFRSPEPNENPTVILLGDLEHGDQWADSMAQLLASHGFPSLALRYWGSVGQETFENIPVEYVQGAIRWLRAFQQPNRRHVILMGNGRGAELALLTATLDKNVSGVIAYAPPSMPFQGLGRGLGQLIPRSPFSLGGVSVPYARTGYPLTALGQVINPFHKQIALREIHERALASATIPIFAAKSIHGPILLFSGGQDAFWPTDTMAATLEMQLDNADHGYYHAHVNYPQAGHGIAGTGYRPTTSNSEYRYAQGGTPQANAYAQQDSWQRVLRFIQTEFSW